MQLRNAFIIPIASSFIAFCTPAFAFDLVPAHAVMAFNQTTCPSGWKAFSKASSRFILGTSLKGDSAVDLGEIKGELNHSIAVSEVPAGVVSHTTLTRLPMGNDLIGKNPSPIDVVGQGADGRKKTDFEVGTTTTNPKQTPLPAPAYVRLLMCEKQ